MVCKGPGSAGVPVYRHVVYSGGEDRAWMEMFFGIWVKTKQLQYKSNSNLTVSAVLCCKA